MAEEWTHVFSDACSRIRVPNRQTRPRGIIGLTNGRLWAKRYPKTFKIPSDRWIKEIKPGDFVMIGRNRERFWVKVTGWEGRKWHGQVWNKLIRNDDLRPRMSIYFYKKNILAIRFKSNKKQAEFSDSRPARVHNPRASFEQADQAARALGAKLDEQPWFRGVGVKRQKEKGGFAVTVRVAPRSSPEIPASSMGVPVHVTRRK